MTPSPGQRWVAVDEDGDLVAEARVLVADGWRVQYAETAYHCGRRSTDTRFEVMRLDRFVEAWALDAKDPATRHAAEETQ